jgi:RNA polymerase sigma-70 factor (ECF subfamily)
MDTPVSLLERLRRPADPEAWARFVHLYTPLLASWASRAGLQDEDAADLIQEVFTLLLRKLPEFSYDSSKSFRAWLRTVALNKWRERVRRPALPVKGDDQTLAGVAGPDPAEAFWEAEYRTHLVGEALRLMQAQFAALIWQACWETVVHDRPDAEVAAALGMTPGAVRVARFRVLTRLRQELAGLLD